MPRIFILNPIPFTDAACQVHPWAHKCNQSEYGKLSHAIQNPIDNKCYNLEEPKSKKHGNLFLCSLSFSVSGTFIRIHVPCGIRGYVKYRIKRECKSKFLAELDPRVSTIVSHESCKDCFRNKLMKPKVVSSLYVREKDAERLICVCMFVCSSCMLLLFRNTRN